MSNTALIPAEEATAGTVANPMRLAFAPLSREQTELIKRTICKGATDDELTLFVSQCNRTGLDPFSKQIHAVKRWDSKANREVMSIQVGIDGFRVIADRTKEVDGQEGPMWCGKDGIWRDVWLEAEAPFAAKVVIFRKGCDKPFTGIARYSSYMQSMKDGSPNQFWRKMPDVMIAKVAEAVALRKAFPNDLSGLYVPEEIDADDAPEQRESLAPNAAEIVSAEEAENLRYIAEGIPKEDADAMLAWGKVEQWEFFPKSKYSKALGSMKKKAGQA